MCIRAYALRASWQGLVMQIVPLPGVGPRPLSEALKSLVIGCENIRGAGGTALARFNAYQRWSNEAARALALLVGPRDVEQLMTTPRYWTLQALEPVSHRNLAGLVDLEIDARLRALTDAVNTLAVSIARRDANQGALVMPDTNVYLHHEQRFEEIDWASVVSAGRDGVAPCGSPAGRR
jgi:hypothetical protein